MIIYLGTPLLICSCDLPAGSLRATGFSPYLVLLRVGFTLPPCLHDAGELLPHHFNLTTALPVSAECFCCTFPIVTYAGRYPASSPYGARTFLTSKVMRDRLSYPNIITLYYNVYGLVFALDIITSKSNDLLADFTYNW